MITNNPATIAEQRDALEHLAAAGFARLLKALQDPRSYTRRGRVNNAAIARKLAIPPRRAAKLLTEAQAEFQ